MNKKALVLPIGTSPLPNYVVGSYLKEKYDKFVLIYSEKNDKINQSTTADYAEALKKYLNLKNDDCLLLPLSNISDSKLIKEELSRYFPSDSFDEVHFNYTGGSKTMVVHIYSFLKDKFKEKFKSSYLDARDYKLLYDYSDEAISLKDTVKIDINTLLSIHLYENIDIEFSDKYEYKQKFNDSFDEISQKIGNVIKDGKSKDFIDWLKDPFRKIFKGEDKLLESAKNFKKHIEKLSNMNKQSDKENQSKRENLSPLAKFSEETPQFIWDILNAFPEDKRINDGQKIWIPDDNVSNKEFSNRMKDTVEFLDGKWLEWYVYNQIINKLIKEELKEGKHFGISLKAQKGNSTNFELDIFLIIGYQLVGISLTTSSRQGDCKLKGFEVIHRVRQIGGDESRAILITGMDKPKTEVLQTDLTYETGSTQKRFVVFGVDDWADIGDKIYEEVFK